MNPPHQLLHRHSLSTELRLPGWNWQLQAERGRAMLDGSQGAEGAELLRQAIEELAAVDAPKWQLDSHRERLKQFDQRNASR